MVQGVSISVTPSRTPKATHPIPHHKLHERKCEHPAIAQVSAHGQRRTKEPVLLEQIRVRSQSEQDRKTHRNIAQPVANTVGTASRMTGVETGVRWWLNRKDSGNNSGLGKVETGTKRRRASNEMDTARDTSTSLSRKAYASALVVMYGRNNLLAKAGCFEVKHGP